MLHVFGHPIFFLISFLKVLFLIKQVKDRNSFINYSKYKSFWDLIK